MSTQPKTFLTPEQYLAIERQATVKSEYFKGEMFAMAGASLAHARLVANLIRELGVQLRGRQCEPASNDLRVYVPATGLFTYPDVAVICGEPKLLDSRLDTLLNPTLLIEVLSPSTEAYDRGRKFEHYRSIDSLQEYVMVSSERMHVDQYSRQADGRWLLFSAGRVEEAVVLPSIECRLSLADIYERVFPQDTAVTPSSS